MPTPCTDSLLTSSNLSRPEFREHDTGRTEAFVRLQRAFTTTIRHPPPIHEAPVGARSPGNKDGVDIDRSNPLLVGGFSTPVLKARVDRIPQSLVRERKHRQSRRKDASKVDDYIASDSTPADQRKSTAKASVTRKRHSSPAKDQAALFIERRERKRANRAIMNPAPIPIKSKENVSNENDQRSKTAKKSTLNDNPRKDKKNRKDPSLMLMQNFAATNIGKDRLTLLPRPNIGVFKKGKASAPMKVGSKGAKRKKDITFSELEFLNNARPQPTQSESSSSSSELSDSRSDKSHQVNLSRFFLADRKENKIPKCQQEAKDSEPSSKKMANPPDASEGDPDDDVRRSVVWDIELNKPLPPGDTSKTSEDSESVVVLCTKSRGWDLPNDSVTSASEKQKKLCNKPNNLPSITSTTSVIQLHSEIRRGSRSPSLTPSHSASQEVVQNSPIPPSNTIVQLAQSFLSPNQQNRDGRSFVSVEQPRFRFRPAHRTKRRISPAPESLLFPLCSGDESRLQRDEQRQGEIILQDIEDYQSMPLTEVMQMCDADSEIPYFIEGQSQNLDYYEAPLTSLEIEQYVNQIYWDDAEPGPNGPMLIDNLYDYTFNDGPLESRPLESRPYELDGNVNINLCTSDIDGYYFCEDGDGDKVDFTQMSEEETYEERSMSSIYSPGTSFHFTKGHSLLWDVEESSYRGLEQAHIEVAESLKDHWVPQKL